MPKIDFIQQLRLQLLILECPSRHMRRMIREVADHHEDLKQAALAEGLPETEAASRADALLGDPLMLAEHLVTVLRRSSWWGRHTVTSFFLLPLLATPILWTALLLFNLWVAFMLNYGGDSKKLHAAAENHMTFHHLTLFLRGIDLIGMGLVTLLFCWLARRSGVRFVWLALACGICSLEGLVFRAQATPHNFSLGLILIDFRHGLMPLIPELTRAAIPLFIAGLIYAFQWQTMRSAHRPIAT